MQLQDLLTNTASHLSEPGAPFDIGCDVNKSKSIFDDWASRDLTKKVRAVQDWCWWDLIIPNDVDLPDKSKPAIIYAKYLMLDSSHFFQLGSWVRTTLLVELHQGFVFETRNTFYILVGPGTRKTVEIEKYLQVF
jgi:hypothetical protein